MGVELQDIIFSLRETLISVVNRPEALFLRPFDADIREWSYSLQKDKERKASKPKASSNHGRRIFEYSGRFKK